MKRIDDAVEDFVEFCGLDIRAADGKIGSLEPYRVTAAAFLLVAKWNPDARLTLVRKAFWKRNAYAVSVHGGSVQHVMRVAPAAARLNEWWSLALELEGKANVAREWLPFWKEGRLLATVTTGEIEAFIREVLIRTPQRF